MKILIRLPNWLGDAVMAEPAARAVRNSFPNAEITALARPYVIPIFEGLTHFDRILRSGSVIADIFSLAGRRIDTALILPNSVSSAVVPFVAGIPRRIGYATYGRRQLLTDAVPYEKDRDGRRKPVPMVDYYLRLARRIGADVSDERPRLVATEEQRRKVDEYLIRHRVEQGRPLIGLNPGAKFGSSKLWLPEYFAELIDRITEETDAVPIIFCAPSEKEIVKRIVSLTKRKERLVDTSEEIVGLSMLKAFIERLSALVTTDTGPRHIAVAFDIPTVVVMGPTDPRYTARHLEKQVVLRAEELDCIACHKKVCPKEHDCMRLITPNMVFDSLIDLLNLTKRDTSV